MIEGKTEIRLIKQDRSIIEGLEAVIGGLPVASVVRTGSYLIPPNNVVVEISQL